MKERRGEGGLHSCTRILGKQWFLWDIPNVAGIVGRYYMKWLIQY